MKEKNWLQTWLSGEPHFTIGGKDRPYLLRWYILPRNPFFNVYLHKFLRDDDDRALHDHPWWFVSIVLKSGYNEHLPNDRILTRDAGSIAFRPATHRHRVQLFDDGIGNRIPCWTLVITGPKVRSWGFWCPSGFVHWKKFVSPTDHGDIGRGCGDDF